MLLRLESSCSHFAQACRWSGRFGSSKGISSPSGSYWVDRTLNMFLIVGMCCLWSLCLYCLPFWILKLAIVADQQCEYMASHFLTYIFSAEDWGAIISMLLPHLVCLNQTNFKLAGGVGDLQMQDTPSQLSDVDVSSLEKSISICYNFMSEKQAVITNRSTNSKFNIMCCVCHIFVMLYGFIARSSSIFIVIWCVDIFRMVNVTFLL